MENQTDKPFKGFNWGKGTVNFMPVAGESWKEFKPTQIHLKEDGTIDDKPSLVIVMEGRSKHMAYGQISLEMLNEGLADIGYKITKI